jgi:hypothetical protein
MILNVRYFYEKTDENYIEYDRMWQENRERMVFLHKNLRFSKQIDETEINEDKDILAIRFPENKILKRNKIFNNILLGKGFIYDNDKVWYPKEVWIYSLFP